MSDDVHALVIILVLLFLLGILLTPLVLFFVYVFYQNGKRKRIRQRILTAQQGFIGGQRWFPVRYASAPRFQSWFKIFPWDGTGILVIGPDSVRFLGETFAGANLNVQFDPTNSRISWLGKCPWPNGAVSWFAFEVPNEKHYFSSETGPFVFGSSNSTKEIYEEGNKPFAGAQRQS